MSLYTYLLEHNRYLNIAGIIVILAIAALFSRDRFRINLRLIITALIFEFIIAFAVLRTAIGQKVVSVIAEAVKKLYEFADYGSGFVFGNLANSTNTPWGFVFAVKVLPIIIFFGAFMALLFHLRIVQVCVAAVSYVVRPLLGTSGAETLCAIANSFLGQTEAPLLIKQYLANMTKSELFVVMVSGMGTISGAILAVFVAMGVPAVHLLAASVMSIFGSIVIAKILLPETERPVTRESSQMVLARDSHNVFDAISKGTSDGLYLALNVGAMLIAFLGLLALLNYVLAYSCYQANYLLAYYDASWRLPELTLNMIFAYIFAPFGALLGFTGQEALAAGQLLGTKVAVNELVAYGELVTMPGLSERTINIMTYALCGFSNFSCIGIQVGGIGALVPTKRAWLTELGLYAVLGGTLTNLLSAMIAGLLL